MKEAGNSTEEHISDLKIEIQTHQSKIGELNDIVKVKEAEIE